MNLYHVIILISPAVIIPLLATYLLERKCKRLEKQLKDEYEHSKNLQDCINKITKSIIHGK